MVVYVYKTNHDTFFKKIGKNIAKYRVAQGYTQETFANKVGISYSYFTQIEAPNVVARMSLEILLDIADALKIDVIELMK